MTKETSSSRRVVDADSGGANGGKPSVLSTGESNLDEKKFKEYVEAMCERFYADEVSLPGLSPGIYFRLLMVGLAEIF